jgi:hypothetical protein
MGFSFGIRDAKLSSMTPEEELKRLNKLIRQYEAVYRTAPNADQRERVQRQLREFQGFREKILAVNVIDERNLEESAVEEEPLGQFPVLAVLVAENAGLPPDKRIASFAAKDTAPTSLQNEMFHLTLYTTYFEREFLPFLTEKQLKLDLKFSMDRDAFYSGFESLQRKIADYREAHQSITEGMVSRDLETEVRKRALKLTRLVEVEAAKFFRAIERFCAELVEDGRAGGVKCRNSDGAISFDKIEGSRMLQGRKVIDALAQLKDVAIETVAYLNIPEIDG